MAKKITITVIVVLVAALGVYRIGWLLSSGSYPFAEVYELPISEEELIEIIKQVKKENPEITLNNAVRIQNSGISYLTDQRDSHWFSFYFYYPDKNQIIHTWTRSTFEGTSQLAFAGISDGLTFGKWTTANQSFWWWQNNERKSEFEERILSQIKAKIE
jgi:hypothetical protein